MEFEQIIQLIKTVSDSSLTEFKIEDGDVKISMKTDKGAKGVPVMAESNVPMIQAAAISSSPAQSVSNPILEVAKGNVVKSPLVGTFYASDSPEGEPFVQVGDTVKKGQPLGIVEAMKLMNEIESEFDGTVTEILVKNEQVVEYGQPMFVIE